MSPVPAQFLAYIFGILAIVLNGVLLIAMFNDHERKKIFVSRLSYVVANLAFADCVNSVFLILLQQPVENIRYVTEPLTDIQLLLSWTVFCVSYATLFFMAVERIVIILPLVSSNLLSIRRTVFCIFVAWFISIAVGLAVNYSRLYAKFFICLFIEICALSFIASHVYILWVLHKRETRHVNEVPSQAPRLQIPHSKSIAQKKATIVVTNLLVVLIVSCVPFFICLQISTVNNTFDETLVSKMDGEIYVDAYHYTSAFLHISFISNPIIYAWHLRMYRKAFYNLVRRLFLKLIALFSSRKV